MYLGYIWYLVRYGGVILVVRRIYVRVRVVSYHDDMYDAARTAVLL